MFLRDDVPLAHSIAGGELILGPLNLGLLEAFDLDGDGRIDVTSLPPGDRTPFLLWLQGYMEGATHILNRLNHKTA